MFSSSKGAAALTVACLVRDGVLDLDQTVATYWPEFAQRGKAGVTVRQLLSHQAGLLGVDGGYTYDELYGHTGLAARLAAQRPLWLPGSAFAYHAVTIGVLADVRPSHRGRATGGVLPPRGRPALVGSTSTWAREALDDQVRAVELPAREELAALPGAMPRLGRGNPSPGCIVVPVDEQPMYVECNEARFRRAGRGRRWAGECPWLAGMYAAVQHEVGEGARLLDDETIGQVGSSRSGARSSPRPNRCTPALPSSSEAE